VARPLGITESDSVLDRIVSDKLQALESWKGIEREASLRARFDSYTGNGAIQLTRKVIEKTANGSEHIQIIAEIKKASPSRGLLAPVLDHRSIARQYTLAGAAGISVVTEANYFLGQLSWLEDVRLLLQTEFPGTRPSVLRKDFLVDP